jgi:serine/threonine protein kinase
MGITEVREGFESFGAGRLTEQELRVLVRTAATAEPGHAAAYIALTSGLRRANQISPALEALLLADIAVATGNAVNLQRTQTGAIDTSGRTVFKRAGEPAPAEPDLSAISALDAKPVPIDEPMYAHPPIASGTGTGTGAGTGKGTGTRTGTGVSTTSTGSIWDTPERLAEPAAPLTRGSVLKGRFELIDELGRGGMGVVYRALDRTNVEFKDRNPYVAIKLLNEEFKRHPLAVRALQREARKAQKLAHPNIVAVFDFDRDGGNVYMVMELLSGRSLDLRLRHEWTGGLDVATVSRYLASMGAALSYAHEQGIVHADFKPSNVFLTEEGVIKVLDFGVARAAQSLADAPGEKTIFDAGQLGAISPAYASLEMLTGQPPDPRDDLYALACIVYELLTGRHPFNRIDAAKARDARLVAERPGSLSRQQWQALQHALAFERVARTASVKDFLAEFAAPARSRRLWPLAAAGVVAVAVIAVLLLLRAQSGSQIQAQAQALIQQLRTTDPKAFAAGVAALQQAPDALRRRALADDQVRASVIGHYESDMHAAEAAPGFDFTHARELLGTLKGLLPDSEEVATLQGKLQSDAQAALAAQLPALESALGQGLLLPAQGTDSVVDVLQRIRHIDPAAPSLSDPRIAAAYLAAAQKATAAGQLDLAASLAQAGITLAPNDPTLQQAKTAIDVQQQSVTSAQRIAQIEQRLSALSPAAGDFLDKALAERDDLGALAAAAPANPTLLRVQSSLQAATTARISQLLMAGDIAGARQLLLNVGDLLPEQVSASENAAVLDASRAQESRALDILERLRRAVLTGRLAPAGGSGAPDLYAQLQKAGASPDLLAAARDLLTYGYLHAERRARAGGDLKSAAARLADATALQPSPTWLNRINEDQQLLSAASSGGTGGSKTTAGAAASSLDAVRQQFANTLRSASLGLPALETIADALDRLEALGASAQELDAGLRQVEDRVLAEITRTQQQDGVDPAQQYARQASDLLVASERIAQVAMQLHDTAVGTTKPFAPDTLAQRDALGRLLAKPAATAQWAGQLHQLLQQLGTAMPVNDPMLVDARHTGVETFVRAAEDARTHQRFADAASLVELARTVDPEAPEAAREAASIAADQSAAEASAANSQQQAGIQVLKDKLTQQSDAGDVAGTTATATALRRVLAGSLYVSTELPQKQIAAYVHMARSQLLAGGVDAALQTIAAGRQKFGTAPELKNLEQRYIVVGDAWDRLSTAVALNVSEQRHYLDQLRGSEGDDYAAIEQMLARTLANRIADQRAANRATLATSLLEAGRTLFPDEAALLEQGKAGALPNTPLAVSQ